MIRLFFSIVADIKESGTLAAQHGIDTSKAAVPDVMELETPIVAEADWTCALKIQNFVRPFTEKAAKEMLGTYGDVSILVFWGIALFRDGCGYVDASDQDTLLCDL